MESCGFVDLWICGFGAMEPCGFVDLVPWSHVVLWFRGQRSIHDEIGVNGAMEPSMVPIPIGSNVRTKIHWFYLIKLKNYMSIPYVLESVLRISVRNGMLFN